jgi:hypothetical protein
MLKSHPLRFSTQTGQKKLPGSAGGCMSKIITDSQPGGANLSKEVTEFGKQLYIEKYNQYFCGKLPYFRPVI